MLLIYLSICVLTSVLAQAVFCGLCCLSVVDTEEMEKAQSYADGSAEERDTEEALMTDGKDKEVGYCPPPARIYLSENTSSSSGAAAGASGSSNGGNSASPYGTFEEREPVKEEKTSLPAKTGIDVDID